VQQLVLPPGARWQRRRSTTHAKPRCHKAQSNSRKDAEDEAEDERTEEEIGGTADRRDLGSQGAEWNRNGGNQRGSEDGARQAKEDAVRELETNSASASETEGGDKEGDGTNGSADGEDT